MNFFKRVVVLSALLFTVAAAAFGADGSVRYYRHLEFNHDSPHVSYAGVYEITVEQAKTVEHYEFVYGTDGRLAEIRNFSSEQWRNHPLTHLGAFRTAYTYEGDREVRRFYDRDGKRVQNLRKVYEEVYSYDKSGFKCGLEFHDLAGKPMESNWGIARYAWEKKGDMVIERRYDLKGNLAPLSPFFQFHISGLKYDRLGHFERHYNLNDKLEVVNSDFGVACYQDTVAANGNLVGLVYLDKDGKIVPSPWQFAIVHQTYDKDGNVIAEEMDDRDGVFLWRSTFAYDAAGKLIETKK
jgi:hypothetical protein